MLHCYTLTPENRELVVVLNATLSSFNQQLMQKTV